MDNTTKQKEVVKDDQFYLREVEYFERAMETIQMLYGMCKVSRDHALSKLKEFAPSGEEVKV